MEWQTTTSFRSLASAVDQVYLVEASPTLRDAQKKLLGMDQPLEEVQDGLRCKSKYSGIPITWYEDIRFVPNGGDPNPEARLTAADGYEQMPQRCLSSLRMSSSMLYLSTPSSRLLLLLIPQSSRHLLGLYPFRKAHRGHESLNGVNWWSRQPLHLRSCTPSLDQTLHPWTFNSRLPRLRRLLHSFCQPFQPATAPFYLHQVLSSKYLRNRTPMQPNSPDG